MMMFGGEALGKIGVYFPDFLQYVRFIIKIFP